MRNLANSQDLARHFRSSVIAKPYVLLYLSHQNRSFFFRNTKVSFGAGNLIRNTRTVCPIEFVWPPAPESNPYCNRRAAASGETGFTQISVPHSKPAAVVNRGNSSMYQ